MCSRVRIVVRYVVSSQVFSGRIDLWLLDTLYSSETHTSQDELLDAVVEAMVECPEDTVPNGDKQAAADSVNLQVG